MLGMLIEDDPVQALVWAEKMRAQGVEDVMVSHSLSEAETMLRHARPEVFVVDVTLPDGDGDDYAKKLRTRYPKAKVVPTSAVDSLQARPGVTPKAELEDHLAAVIRSKRLPGLLKWLWPVVAAAAAYGLSFLDDRFVPRSDFDAMQDDVAEVRKRFEAFESDMTDEVKAVKSEVTEARSQLHTMERTVERAAKNTDLLIESIIRKQP